MIDLIPLVHPYCHQNKLQLQQSECMFYNLDTSKKPQQVIWIDYLIYKIYTPQQYIIEKRRQFSEIWCTICNLGAGLFNFIHI